VRERFEDFSASDWGRDPRGVTDFLIQRVMPCVDLHVGSHFQGFLTLTSNLVWGRDPRPLDRDDLDLLQAFGALSFGSLTVRGGRQEIQYASSRLVSIREGPNVRLSFDGLRLSQRLGKWQVDGFALVPVRVRPGVFDDRPEPGQSFLGIYATGPVLADWLGLDLYYLVRLRENATFEQGAARELRHTIGTRIWGKTIGLDYNIELTYQAGSFGAGTISAWMVASAVGYTFDGLPGRPRLGAQTNAMSGDSNPRRSGLQTFNPLFPRGAYFSQANLIGPMNLVDWHPALKVTPVHGLDRYSPFFAGPFLRVTGPGKDVDFVALWVSYAI
jgi:Alginate export